MQYISDIFWIILITNISIWSGHSPNCWTMPIPDLIPNRSLNLGHKYFLFLIWAIFQELAYLQLKRPLYFSIRSYFRHLNNTNLNINWIIIPRCISITNVIHKFLPIFSQWSISPHSKYFRCFNFMIRLGNFLRAKVFRHLFLVNWQLNLSI